MLQVCKLRENAKLPVRGKPGSAGLDLCSVEEKTIYPGEKEIISTGISIEMPEGYTGLIWPRSGLAANHAIDVLAGHVDPDYRGEIMVVLINHGKASFKVDVGDRIAQLLIQPYAHIDPVEANYLGKTERGEGGFGSTGRA